MISCSAICFPNVFDDNSRSQIPWRFPRLHTSKKRGICTMRKITSFFSSVFPISPKTMSTLHFFKNIPISYCHSRERMCTSSVKWCDMSVAGETCTTTSVCRRRHFQSSTTSQKFCAVRGALCQKPTYHQALVCDVCQLTSTGTNTL